MQRSANPRGGGSQPCENHSVRRSLEEELWRDVLRRCSRKWSDWLATRREHHPRSPPPSQPERIESIQNGNARPIDKGIDMVPGVPIAGPEIDHDAGCRWTKPTGVTDSDEVIEDLLDRCWL